MALLVDGDINGLDELKEWHSGDEATAQRLRRCRAKLVKDVFNVGMGSSDLDHG